MFGLRFSLGGPRLAGFYLCLSEILGGQGTLHCLFVNAAGFHCSGGTEEEGSLPSEGILHLSLPLS